jgi:hypothetical protein
MQDARCDETCSLVCEILQAFDNIENNIKKKNDNKRNLEIKKNLEIKLNKNEGKNLKTK